MKRLLRSCSLLIVFAVLMPTVALAQGGATLDPITDLTTLNHYDIVNDAAAISAAEQMMLQDNHFVVTDDKAWERFVDAYAWIFWKDLPVLITTDSMLHAVHQSYADLLIDLETNVMRPELTTLLDETIAAHEAAVPATSDPVLQQAHDDVATYLEVARALLYTEDQFDWSGAHDGVTTHTVPTLSADAQVWFDTVIAADSLKVNTLFGPVLNMEGDDISGESRKVDMTMFTPRGHYPANGLSNYFLAMLWLGQVDFRLSHTDFDSATQSFVTTTQPNHIAASMMLRSAIDTAGQRDRWDTINAVLELLVGESDNTTLIDLDQLLSDAGLNAPEDALTADPATLVALFEANDYGTQRITGQIIEYDHSLDDSQTSEQTALPISFMVFGTRFAIDSWVTGEVVFDRLKDSAGESIFRALPDPNDVAYVLGNDRALDHLQSDPDALGSHDYMGELTAMRTKVDTLPEAWWDEPVYNGWLNLIRSLNEPAADGRVPAVMQTEPWADKNLQTQLASWAQLRHDNILYVKQSFTISFVTCEFADWYIEPQVGFYEELVEYARAGLTLTAQLEAAGLSEDQLTSVYRADTYFASLEGVSTILIDMIERQLNNETFTYEDEMFIQNLIQQQMYRAVQGGGSGGPNIIDFERWDGWYTTLFYDEDDTAAVIADIHTNPTNDPASPLYPPRVAHVATGDVSPIYFVADKGDGPTLYVGPAFSYYEVTTEGDASSPAERLTDQDWQPYEDDYEGLVYPTKKPEPPTWTESFRVSPTKWGSRLAVNPEEVYVLRSTVRNTLWDFLFGDLELIPGTINQPTEPSGVRVEASTVDDSVDAYRSYDNSYRQLNVSFERYAVEFTNEGSVDRPGFTAQFFVDLSELAAEPDFADNVYVELLETNACQAAVNGFETWNAAENIYYMTIDVRRRGLAMGESCRVVFDIVSFYPDAYNPFSTNSRPEPIPLDRENDFSAQGLSTAMVETEFIPIFDGDVMIGGSLPSNLPVVPTLVGFGMAVAKSPMAQMKLAVIGMSVVMLTAGGVVAGRRMKNGRKLMS